MPISETSRQEALATELAKWDALTGRETSDNVVSLPLFDIRGGYVVDTEPLFDL